MVLLACGVALAALALLGAFITPFFVIAALPAIACATAGALRIPRAPVSGLRAPLHGRR